MPFPFVEAPRMRKRPAVVVSRALPPHDPALMWVVMVTSAANRGWADDISLEHRYTECGLQVPCVIRTAKISTVEIARSQRVGSLPGDILQAVRGALASNLAL